MENAAMETLNFNNNWIFVKNFQGSCLGKEVEYGEPVSLPHCFNATDGQNGDGMFHGKCLYQKKFHLSKEYSSRCLFLEVGAAALTSEVFVNGQKAGSSDCGFALYRVLLNPFIKLGDNLISIIVDNSSNDNVYPLMADFSFYGGLYRGVNLVAAEPLHFDLMDHGRDGIYVTQRCIGENLFELKITGNIVNELDEKEKANVKATLFDKGRNVVWEKNIDIEVSKKTNFELVRKIDHPNLWMGIENPYLYQVKCELSLNGRVYDLRTVEIGFRTIEITPDRGMFLNGKPIKIKGVSRHQDFGGIGNALTKEHMDLDMSIIKEIGANSVRLSHYQQNDYFYTLCDRNGILVWAEIPFISIPTAYDEENRNAKDQLERLIKQAYNHCSIYCWGVQNEIELIVKNERIYKMVNDLTVLARKLDSSRYIAQANEYTVCNDSKLNDLTDLVGYNLYYGWYYGEMSDLEKRLDDFHKTKPNIPVLVTEYGVDANPRLHSANPARMDYSEEFQVLFLHHALQAIYERPFVLGGYVWALFDFGSNNRNEGGMKGKNQKGLVTIDRKLKKDSFYLYKAYWSKEPFVKLAGSRFTNRNETVNDIIVFSNLKQVRLYLNDSNVGEMIDTDPVKKFSGIRLPLEKNIIKAEAFDEHGNVYCDEMILNRVSEKDKSYTLEKTEGRRHVTNWFERFDLTHTKEITVQEGFYSIFDTIEEIEKSDKAKSVLGKYFGNTMESPQFQMMKGLMTIEDMHKSSIFRIPKELLNAINSELNVIPKS